MTSFEQFQKHEPAKLEWVGNVHSCLVLFFAVTVRLLLSGSKDWTSHEPQGLIQSKRAPLERNEPTSAAQ